MFLNLQTMNVYQYFRTQEQSDRNFEKKSLKVSEVGIVEKYKQEMDTLHVYIKSYGKRTMKLDLKQQVWMKNECHGFPCELPISRLIETMSCIFTLHTNIICIPQILLSARFLFAFLPEKQNFRIKNPITYVYDEEFCNILAVFSPYN